MFGFCPGLPHIHVYIRRSYADKKCSSGRESFSLSILQSPWEALQYSLAELYSKTSNKGYCGKRTTSLEQTVHLPPIDFTIELIPPRSEHLSTPNNGHWSGPNIPWPIQNYLRKQTVKLQPHNGHTQWSHTRVTHKGHTQGSHTMVTPYVC